MERFGQLDVVVAIVEKAADSAHAFAEASGRMARGGRLLVIVAGAPTGEDESEGVVRAHVHEVALGVAGVHTCNALTFRASSSPPKGTRAPEPEDAAELVAFLCGRAADAVTGAVLALA